MKRSQLTIKMTMELTHHIDMLLQQQWIPGQISGKLKWEDKKVSAMKSFISIS
jgi:hypothetical protein